ncbi:hypothetical protein E8E11_004958 [Didymella keratinophila]|nr:hypothetical protein E8E11_004958 [Didymella keratinophila]
MAYDRLKDFFGNATIASHDPSNSLRLALETSLPSLPSSSTPSVQTLQLAKDFKWIRSLSEYSVATRKKSLERVTSLLEAGADPNIIISTYELQYETIERILSIKTRTIYIESSYEYVNRAQSGAFKSVDWDKASLTSLKSSCNPLVDSIALQDPALTTVLLQHHARLHEVTGFFPGFEPRKDMYEIILTAEEFAHSTLSSPMAVDTKTQRLIWGIMQQILLDQTEAYQSRKFLALVGSVHIFSEGRRLKKGAAFWEEHLPIPSEMMKHVRKHPTLLAGLSYGLSQVLIAVLLDNTQLLQSALKHGSRPTDYDARGVTALHLAASNPTTSVCCCLIDAGADVNASVTPLLEVVYFGHDPAARTLLKAGASLNVSLCREGKYVRQSKLLKVIPRRFRLRNSAESLLATDLAAR